MRQIVMAGAALLALAGCNSRTEEAPADNGANVAGERSDGNGAEDAGEAARAPTNGALLEGIPTYPNVEGDGVRMAGTSAQGNGGLQTFRTRDSAGRVAQFYADAAERAGFTIANRTDMGHTSGVTARGSRGELLNVTATRVGPVTEVQIIAARGRPQ